MKKISWNFLSVFLVLKCFDDIYAAEVKESSDDDDDFTIDLTPFGSKIFGSPIASDKNDTKENQNAQQSGNPEESGPYLEGDLLMPSSARNGMRAESYRWRNGEIPFVIQGSFNAYQMDTIERSMIEYHRNTCIKFIPRRSIDKDFISIENSATGCWSSVGRIGGKQVVNLQTPACLSKIGTVIHELKHSVGFMHEQNREDRDTFVKILTKNIKPGMEANFDKARAGQTNSFGVKYDYGSVMHYSATSFSKNGKPTIEAKQKNSATMGQRDGFSKLDIEKVNKMYKCSGTGSTGTTKSPNQSTFGNLVGNLFPR